MITDDNCWLFKVFFTIILIHKMYAGHSLNIESEDRTVIPVEQIPFLWCRLSKDKQEET